MLSIFEKLLSIIALIIAFPVMIVVCIVGLFDTGSPIFIQERVGKNQKPFYLIKFRTMDINTKSVASHLASSNGITKFGSFLRKTKLDELPQLINVLKGEMSFVGPRPNLFNQIELLKAREKLNVYDVLPGITGLAQVSKIDMSTPGLLAKTDRDMLDTMTLKKYFYYIFRTIAGAGKGDAVKRD